MALSTYARACGLLVLALALGTGCGGPEAKEPAPVVAPSAVATAVIDTPPTTEAPSVPSPPSPPPSASAAATPSADPLADGSKDEAPSSEGTPSLSASDIMSVIRAARSPTLRKCSGSLPEGSPPVRVLVKLTIGKSGNVTSLDASGADKPLASCVARELRTMKFPKSNGETKVNVPFVFQRQ